MGFPGLISFHELSKPYKLCDLLDEFPESCEPSSSLQDEMFRFRGNSFATTASLLPTVMFFLLSLLQ